MFRLLTLNPFPPRAARTSSRFPLLGLFLVLLLLILCLGLFGCATTSPSSTTTAPSSALKTFDTLYQDAVSADDVAITAATTALNAGLISGAQATKILAVTDSVKAALDLANTLAQSGNTAAANSNLAASVGAIAILSSCLTAKPLTAASFAACAVKLLPVIPVTS